MSKCINILTVSPGSSNTACYGIRNSSLDTDSAKTINHTSFCYFYRIILVSLKSNFLCRHDNVMGRQNL